MLLIFTSFRNTDAAAPCVVGTINCIVGEGGGDDSTPIPSNYIVNTGLVIQLVDTAGNNEENYLIFVRAADKAVSINDSDIILGAFNGDYVPNGLFYTSELIGVRKPMVGMNDGAFYLQSGITHQYFRANSSVSGLIDKTNTFTILMTTQGISHSYFDGDTTGFNYYTFPYVYMNADTEEFIASENDGMNGSLGAYIDGTQNAYGQFANPYANGAVYFGVTNTLYIYTNYDNYTDIPTTDGLPFGNYVIINQEYNFD